MQKRAPIRQAITQGMAWNALLQFLSKSLSIFGQIVLGWYLSKEDFGLYALAIGAAAVFTALKNGGTDQVLIQKDLDYKKYQHAVWRVALAINTSIVVAIVIAGQYIAHLYNSPGVLPLLYIIALSLILATPVVTSRSVLAIQMRFGDIARIEMKSAFLRYGSMVLFAVMGLGPISFVLPLVLVSLYEVVAFGKRADHWPWKKLNNENVSGAAVLRETRWLMIGAVGISLVNNGDYLVLGYFVDSAALGIYFFAFQLVTAAMASFEISIRTVMFPAFASLSQNKVRQAELYLRSMRLISLVTASLAVGLALVSPLLIHWLWNGKWDESIQIAQVLCLMIPFVLMEGQAYTVIAARGAWRTRTILLLVEATGILVFSAIGVAFGTLLTVAIVLVSFRIVYTAILLRFSARFLNTNNTAAYFAIARNCIIPVLIGLGCLIFYGLVLTQNGSALFAMSAITYAIILLFVSFILLKQENSELGLFLKSVKATSKKD